MNVIITSHISAHIYIHTYILYIYVSVCLSSYVFAYSKCMASSNDGDTTPTISNQSFPRELLQ